MGSETKIQWTDTTWNPIRGCSRVSAGCVHCYAEGAAHRANRQAEGAGRVGPYDGLVKLSQLGEPRWNGKVATVPEHLLDPMKWRRGRMIFVNSMSDLFHESVPPEFLLDVIAVMLASPQHRFQVLTKRSQRMRETLTGPMFWSRVARRIRDYWLASMGTVAMRERWQAALWRIERAPFHDPADHIWWGVSVEDQANAGRIEDLLATNVEHRFISYEPAIGPLTIGLMGTIPSAITDRYRMVYERIGWVIVGGESGSESRAFHADWARAIVRECKDTATPVFVKQLGALCFDRGDNASVWPVSSNVAADAESLLVNFRHPKGGDPAEWPEDLRVREWPPTMRGEQEAAW